ncbi:hypothetical protein PC118_g20931 [Phytophthora cactorum]|uniref:Uncharacterized protein n=1 Tax=Phytophthora cactorum TaxID=29920 RepID=A0A8T1F488_9STRA|nr:hypothetical protein PC118_g20931 [Phytophthora cactorum]
MDACDVGLCALDSSSKETLTYQFNDQVRQQISDFKSGDANGFDKNFRELLSCPLRHSWRSEIVAVHETTFMSLTLKAEDLVVLDLNNRPTLSEGEAWSVHI